MKKEFFGTDVAAALARAASALGTKVEDSRYRIVETKTKMVAIVVDVPEKSKTVENRADRTPVMSQEEMEARQAGMEEWAVKFCDGIFRRMGIASVTTVIKKDEQVILEVDLPDEGLDLRRGAYRGLRGAVQHLVGRAVSSEAKGERHIIVDIGATLAQRSLKMKRLAGYLAKKTNEIEQPIYIRLLDSQDRRLLHVALLENEQSDSLSLGDKQFRILSVAPKKRS